MLCCPLCPKLANRSLLFLLSALPDPNQPDTWYLLAMTTFDGRVDQSYLFTFDLGSGAIIKLAALDYSSGMYPLELEGNGRYLATVTNENNVPILLSLRFGRGTTVNLRTAPSQLPPN